MQVNIDYEKEISKETFISQVQVNEFADALDYLDEFAEYCDSHHYRIIKVVIV